MSLDCLSEALTTKYGRINGLTIMGNKITEWPYNFPIPSNKELKKLCRDHIKAEKLKPKKLTLEEKLDLILKRLDTLEGK